MTEAEKPPTPMHESLVSLVTLGGSPAERAQARMEVCADVLRNLGTYVPYPFPVAPAFLADLRALSPGEVRDHLRGNKDRCYQFGTWRMQVTNVEGANAARLSVLGNTLRALIELRGSFEPETIDLAIEHLGRWVEAVWMVQVPLEGDLRGWATLASINRTVLPSAWRGL